MNFAEVVHVGKSGFLYTSIGITFALTIGMLLALALGVERVQAFLISAGTAICGGSAIAALGPVTNADDEQMAVSMGTVFVLNSVALFIFPLIGHLLHLSQAQFGLWAALAIHDTSSVVGAAAKYGALALSIATTVKLARALWIVPISLGTAVVTRSRTRIRLPWFILYFCIAAILASYVPIFHTEYVYLAKLGRLGLSVTLFLIGASISASTVKQVGARAMIQGVLLWAVVGTISLWAIDSGWIHL
jgi:uncharacterized integral membrane protein (TIGR00698 family)